MAGRARRGSRLQALAVPGEAVYPQPLDPAWRARLDRPAPRQARAAGSATDARTVVVLHAIRPGAPVDRPHRADGRIASSSGRPGPHTGAGPIGGSLGTVMAENVTNQLLLEHLKAVQAKLAAMAEDVQDLKADMRGLKAHMAGFMQSEVGQDSAIASMQSRLERIERRLELQD